MTSYFDDKATFLRDIRRQEPEHVRIEMLREFEKVLVRDVTICAEFPGMHEKLRQAIHKAVWFYGVFTRPMQHPNPKAEDDDAIPDVLEDLVSELHSVFHEVGRWARQHEDTNIARMFSDSPNAPLRWLESNGEEQRDKLAPPSSS